MMIPTLFNQSYTVLLSIGVVFSTLLLLTFLCIYVCVYRRRCKNQTNIALAKKRLLYSSPASIAPQIPTKATDRFVFPLPKLQHTEIFPQYSVNEPSSSYKTFDLTKQQQQQHRYLSSDSSYTSSNQRRSNPLPTISLDAVKSKLHQIHRRSSPLSVSSHPLETINSEQISSNPHQSDSDDEDNESLPTPLTPSFEYNLTEYFRIELIYKLYYSIEDNQLFFQIIRLVSLQPLIERCFPIFICKIRLFTTETKQKPKKYFSKKNPMNEIFKFDLNQYTLEQSYLKIHVLGQHKNDKRLDLGHISLVLNQYENLVMRIGHHHDGGLSASEQHTKAIPLYEDRIDMITQQQMTSENEARALICLVYENDRCLLHVGLIKILGIQSLLKPSTGPLHQRDLIQIKICTIIDGKIIAKDKCKAVPIEKHALTFNTSFPFDYLSLHKTSVRITIICKKPLIKSQNKLISIIEFGSTQLKNQQTFQHWTDTLSAPNRPHVHWHVLQPIDGVNDK